jgi:hypothetical protein
MKLFALSLGIMVAFPFGFCLAVTSLVAAIDPWHDWTIPGLLAIPTGVGLIGIFAGLG